MPVEVGMRHREDLHVPAGSRAAGDDPLVLTPEAAGWSYAGLRIVSLTPGASRTIATAGDEVAVLPLAGGCTVEVDGRSWQVAGRESVFSRVTDFVYVPRDSELRITSAHGGRFALPMARADRRFEPAYCPADAVPVELRGAGHATRQLNNFMAPDMLQADRLVAVEVITPAGNWSSYPAHKHDEQVPGGEACLEEIYYFELAGGDAAWGLHRTYDPVEGWDTTVAVRSGDAFLVPRGYHGPDMAPPGYDMYFLNVLAGPANERSLAFSDDPAQHWIRESWAGEAQDPRLPMTSADGIAREA